MSQDNTIEIGEVSEAAPASTGAPSWGNPITGTLRALVISPGHADLVSLRLEDRHAGIYFCCQAPARIFWRGKEVTLSMLVKKVSEAKAKVTVTLHPDRSRYGLSTYTEFVEEKA